MMCLNLRFDAVMSFLTEHESVDWVSLQSMYEDNA